MTKSFLRSALLATAVIVSLLLPSAPTLNAQDASDPSTALSAAIVAACRDNEAQFFYRR